MDLKNTLDTKSAANEGCEIEILSAAYDVTGFFITVLGEDSDEFREVTHAQQQRRLKKAVQNRFSPDQLKIGELEADNIAVLAACTKSWRMEDGSPVEFGGKELPCTRDNAVMLYTELPMVRQQVEEAIKNRTLFTKRSAKK